MKKLLTDNVIGYIEDIYAVKAECPFEPPSRTEVFRSPVNGKWFAVLLRALPLEKLGVNSSECADVLNLKCDPLLNFNVVDNAGVFPAYHMNKEHWISARLDGKISEEELRLLIDMSYELVNKKSSRRKRA